MSHVRLPKFSPMFLFGLAIREANCIVRANAGQFKPARRRSAYDFGMRSIASSTAEISGLE
jgi:hypothetical protein